jgi:hypothetical protein
MSLILLVDPDPDAVMGLRGIVDRFGSTRLCCDFVTARHILAEFNPDFVITNARLREYNGLHLAYMARGLGLTTRYVIYSDRRDIVLAREIQSVGGFYELRSRLEYCLPAYLTSPLPPFDRRNIESLDRRHVVRGGRRGPDLHYFAIAPGARSDELGGER